MEQFIENNPALYVSIIFTFIGLILFLAGLYIYLKSTKTRYWKKVPGIVLESNIEIMPSVSRDNYQKTYRPHVKYKYKIDGAEIESDKIFFGDRIYKSNKSRSTRILKLYPKNKEIIVFVNPYNKDESVLIKGIRKSTIASIVIGAMILISGIIAMENHKALEVIFKQIF